MSAYSAQISSTTSPHFTRPEGTVTIPAPQPASELTVRVSQWLNSAEARQYDDKWVLLNDACDVLDVDASAAGLVARHAEHVDPLIVFVQPSRVHFG